MVLKVPSDPDRSVILYAANVGRSWEHFCIPQPVLCHAPVSLSCVGPAQTIAAWKIKIEACAGQQYLSAESLQLWTKVAELQKHQEAATRRAGRELKVMMTLICFSFRLREHRLTVWL